MKTRPPIAILPVAFLAGVLLAASWLSTGCGTRQLVTPDGKVLYKSTRFASDEKVKRVEYRTADGSVLVVEGYSGNQSEGAAMVAEATARGLGQGLAGSSGVGALGPAASVLIPAGQKLVQKNGTAVLAPKDDPSVPRLEIEPLSLKP